MSSIKFSLCRNFTAAAIAIFATPIAMADACTVTSDGGGSCQSVLVTQMYVEPGAPGQNTGNIYVQINGATTALTCTTAAGGFTLPFGDANYKVAYSTLLASQLAGRILDIRIVKDSSNNCTLGYLILH